MAAVGEAGQHMAWRLIPLAGGRTRLLCRLKVRYAWESPDSAILTLILLEFGDFPMMRRVLRGIKLRAERMTRFRAPKAGQTDLTLRASPT